MEELGGDVVLSASSEQLGKNGFLRGEKGTGEFGCLQDSGDPVGIFSGAKA